MADSQDTVTLPFGAAAVVKGLEVYALAARYALIWEIIAYLFADCTTPAPSPISL